MASLLRLERKVHMYKKELRVLKRCYSGKIGRRAGAVYKKPPKIYVDSNYEIHVLKGVLP